MLVVLTAARDDAGTDYDDVALRFPCVPEEKNVLTKMLMCLAYAHRFVTGALHRELPHPVWFARLDGPGSGRAQRGRAPDPGRSVCRRDTGSVIRHTNVCHKAGKPDGPQAASRRPGRGDGG